ncbi:MAG: Ig-like domain-containing protein [Pseudomonadales bacterium]|nr:Ig-like domain-containing protein [Pseudomonadales bacterium]
MFAFSSITGATKKFLFFIILAWGIGVGPVAVAADEQPVSPALTFEDISQALQDVLHTVNEIGYFILDFADLFKEDPLNGLLELLNFIGQKLGLIDGGDGIAGDLPIPGPGLGNQSYPEEDLFQPIGWVNHDNGLPGVYPGRKAFGTNLGMMIDGYFFTLFAPDSGKGPGGFLFYDVSNPYQPKLMRRIYEAETRTEAFKEPHAFGIARINGRRYMAFQSTIGVEFWDFTDLNNLERVGEIDLPGVDGGDYSNVAWQLTWQAPYVYVASSEQGIFIVDAADPSNPVLADRDGEANPIPVSALGGFRVGPIFTFGNQLVISSMQNLDGFASLDISDPVNPILLDRIPDLDQFYYASCFNGEHMAVSVRGPTARMVLYDLKDPSEFILTDDQLAIPGQLYCAFQDQYVFQGAEDRVHKIDVSDPQNPVEVGSGTISGPLVRLVDHGQVSPLGNLVFVGNDHGTGSAFMPHDVEPDTQPPHVLITAPRTDATNVASQTAIGISFSDVLDFSSVNEESVRILDEAGGQVAGLYSLQNGIVNFTPLEPLAPFSDYQIVVPTGGVRDVMGNAVTVAFEGGFTTGAGSLALDVDVTIDEITAGVDESGANSAFDIELDRDLVGATYEWDFGDGSTSGLLDSPNTNHEYSAPGHYQVRLTIRLDGLIHQETFIKTVVPPLTEQPAVQTSTLAQTGSTIYVVNPDNDTVTAIDKTLQQVVWESNVGSEPQTVSLLNNELTQELWVSVRSEDKIAVLDLNGNLIRDIALGYGSQPFAVIDNQAQNTVLVSVANGVVLLDRNGNELARETLVDPRAIAVSGDGNQAFVTRLTSPDDGAQIYQLDLSQGLDWVDTLHIDPDTTTVDTQDRARGVANYLFDVAISPSGQDLNVVAKKDNIFRGEFRDGQTLEHDRTVRAVTHRINFAEQTLQEADFDNRANPRAAVYSPWGDYLFVAMQGSNKVAVMDVFSGSQRVEIETPLAPQGLMIDGVTGHLYVHNFMSRSVSVHDIAGILNSSNFSVSTLAEVSTVASEQLAPSVLLGKQIFYNSDDPRMSMESYFSCASCHVDGGQDGRVWDFTERGEGLRNTITLKGRAGLGHGNVHWTANFDEIQDFENDIRGGFGGTGFLSDEEFENTRDPLGNAKAGLSEELDALADYVSSLAEVEKSPYKTTEGALTASAQRGAAIYEGLDCASCHQGPQYTDGVRHVLDTINASSGMGISQPLNEVGIETPTLLGLWSTAPYFHHGEAIDLSAVINQSGHGNAQSLSAQDQADLINYLLTLDGREVVTLQRVQGFKLRNQRWGCLDVHNDRAVVNECDQVETTWWFDNESRLRLANGDQCLEHNGKALFWSRAVIADCSDSPRQQFNRLDSGQIELSSSNAFVLDAFGTRANSKVGSWWRHNGDNQRWVLQ